AILAAPALSAQLRAAALDLQALRSARPDHESCLLFYAGAPASLAVSYLYVWGSQPRPQPEPPPAGCMCETCAHSRQRVCLPASTTGGLVSGTQRDFGLHLLA